MRLAWGAVNEWQVDQQPNKTAHGHTGDDKVDDRMTVGLAIVNGLALISHPEPKGQPSRPHVTL